MKVTPIAFDSLGVRSMATFVETQNINIIIDPSVRLAPLRYNLPPHPIEIQKMNETWQKIVEYAKVAQVVIITHYHYDHHNPEMPELFKDKILIIKNPQENINYNQKVRAQEFLSKISQFPKKLYYADKISFYFGKTTIKCSDAVFHGMTNYTGYVIELLIAESDTEKLIFTSDVCGLILPSQVRFIIENNPTIIIADGPTHRYSNESWAASVNNVTKIIANTDVKTFIIDHHLLRDFRYNEYFKQLKAHAAAKKINLVTAAEYLNEKNLLLEVKRKKLYELYPPTQNNVLLGKSDIK
ncbi:MAG: hypothetical protein NZ601_00100 [candidate division WOR-3 bacterium]|nr:hypothetical protein [candidate division WOR-3 bacterium]MDW7988293.1 hypothetical protein [candidate division WOR-3 bacterium]